MKPLIDRVLEDELNKLSLSRTQNAKRRLAIEIINALSKHAVEEKRLKDELIKTGKFSKEEAENFLKIAVTKGILFEGENGYYPQKLIAQ